jgi:glycosyltransferase involved in cell wall biosynthesis
MLIRRILLRARSRANTVFGRDGIRARVAAHRSMSGPIIKEYTSAPLVTAIVQVFNKRDFIGGIIRRLQQLPIDEIICIDDGSVDDSLGTMLPLMTRKNDFILRANDLFEVRTYDRALSMARGRYAVLLQDDDLIPINSRWVTEAIRSFEADSSLLILGGLYGLTILPPDPVLSGVEPKYKVTGDFGGSPGINKYQVIWSPTFELDGVCFQYVMAINRAPQWVRRVPFLQEIGIDQAFVPFQCDDVDSCLRAWRAGWRVGLYSAKFSHGAESGMKLFNPGRLQEQTTRNWKRVYDRHLDIIASGSLARSVSGANNELTARYER